MCIIINNANGKKLDSHIIENSLRINPDGMGFIDLERKKLIRTMKEEEQRKLLESPTKFLAHCRYATVGKVSKDNTHPVKFKWGYLFQNGTVNGFENTKQTDTASLAEVLNLFSRKKDIIAFLDKFDSRFLILWNDESIDMIGDWIQEGGIYFSKSNVLEKPKVIYSKDYYEKYGRAIGKSRESVTNKFDHDYPVAVYGTLKLGYGNNAAYLGASNRGSHYLDTGYTLKKYRLVCAALPYLFENSSSEKKNVEVEIYKVDKFTLARLDSLEGHPTHYRRKLIDVEIFEYGSNQKPDIVKCWVYFYQGEDRSKSLPSCYGYYGQRANV